MSEKIILNKSFNSNKINQKTIYIEEERFVFDCLKNEKSYTIDMPINEIVRIDLLNGKCPKPFKRNINIVFEAIAALLFVLGIAFRKNTIFLAVFAISGFCLMLITAFMAKLILQKSPDAVEICVYSNNKKMRALGCNTTSRDYNNVLRVVKECKKINKSITLNIQTKK